MLKRRLCVRVFPIVLCSRADFKGQSYRIENFSNAAEVYEQLAETHVAHHDEENDIRINSGATDAQLEWREQGELARKKKPSREDLEGFETAYNAACSAIAREELVQGEILLKTAKGILQVQSFMQAG